MILNRKRQHNRRRSADPAAGSRAAGSSLSPRFTKLLHESWWLLIVVVFVYLALVLATYHKSDAAWSFSGTGAPLQNKGGVVGAWIADLLLYLFGVSAWWWVAAGVVLVVSGYRRLTRDSGERYHPWLA